MGRAGLPRRIRGWIRSRGRRPRAGGPPFRGGVFQLAGPECSWPKQWQSGEGPRANSRRVARFQNVVRVLAQPLGQDRELRRRMGRLVPLRASVDHPNVLKLIRSVDGGQRLHMQSVPPGARTLADLQTVVASSRVK